MVLDGLPTQQLAYELGFEDASNFVKYFKKHTLITPSRFQKQFQGV
ncbi:helix-turn-helix domain-containing protein [Photobacterium carnosum]